MWQAESDRGGAVLHGRKNQVDVEIPDQTATNDFSDKCCTSTHGC